MRTTNSDTAARDRALVSPYDTATSSATRFALELWLWSIAVVAAAVVWAMPIAIAFAGALRAGWLLSGAPMPAPMTPCSSFIDDAGRTSHEV